MKINKHKQFYKSKINYCSIIIFSLLFLLQSCSDTSTNLKNENLIGVWKSNKELSIAYNNNSWIPNNLHIDNTQKIIM